MKEHIVYHLNYKHPLRLCIAGLIFIDWHTEYGCICYCLFTILFMIPVYEHLKCRQDPLIRAMNVWNELPVDIRNADTKSDTEKFY